MAILTEEDVVRARARRSAGSNAPEDVEADRYGTGQEMGLSGIPVAALYEMAKPALRASPALNQILGAVAGPEQMVDESSSQASPGQALRNVGAVSAGALSGSRLGRLLLEGFSRGR